VGRGKECILLQEKIHVSKKKHLDFSEVSGMSVKEGWRHGRSCAIKD
jgi:hypothetical protein